MDLIKILGKAANFLFGKMLFKKHVFISDSLEYLRRDRLIDP